MTAVDVTPVKLGDKLIDERLLHQEALRRGIEPDDDWVEAEFAKIEKRYAASPQWSDGGEALVEDIRRGLDERSRIRLLEEKISEVSDPSESELRAYYENHKDKFTSPEQIKVTTILLTVEPWRPKETWDQAREKAEQIHAAIKSGASFDSYAKQYPPNKQEQLGYLHRGMMGDVAQDAIDKLQPGDVSEVVTLLEGVAIFRLDERRTAQLNLLERVRDRAVQLWKRERREQVRDQAMQALRDKSIIELTNPDFHLEPLNTGQSMKRAEGKNSQSP